MLNLLLLVLKKELFYNIGMGRNVQLTEEKKEKKVVKDITKLIVSPEIKVELHAKLYSGINLNQVTFWNDLITQMNDKIIKYSKLLKAAETKIEYLEEKNKELSKIKKPTKIAEAIQILKEEGYKIKISQSTFGDLITFWIYTCIGGIPDEERKVLGKWIMKLIDKEEAPTLFKTNDTNYDAYRFFNQFTDDDGQYDVNINLVL